MWFVASIHEVTRRAKVLKLIVVLYLLSSLWFSLACQKPALYLLSMLKYKELSYLLYCCYFAVTLKLLLNCGVLSYACGCGCCMDFQCNAMFLFACPAECVNRRCLAGHQLVDTHLDWHFAWNQGAVGDQHARKGSRI